ncbi:hypothetical protein RTG_01100 [Rhodotorula toruloides ATCC 204091]|uniref:Uncharacterized protein n=2 Tax=Rhodotorula toruloides TaxID=5286 RepID=A0A0K3C3T2_RHOTO|nr:hypothetical protein RTG_01100 [Rhodotorula toruloides ATCC 204091]
MSWLSALPSHSIFTLPPPTPSTPSTDNTLNTSSRPTDRLAKSTISHSASSKSLFGISTATSTSRTHGHDVGRILKGARTSRMVVARGTDLVVAVGSELRMASLAEVKARSGAETADGEADLGEYKVLNTPAINFEIQQLVLNSTSKLLAVVGAHSVVVVVLPRRGWANTVGKTIECRCLPVGAFYHSLPGSPAIASALWHPLGADSSSLLLLTTDCTLREYSISTDVSEPSQTLSFLPQSEREKGKKRGFGFSAVDEDARTAAGMCVGDGKGDWGMMTLYAVMKNGDVVALCPFLPKKAAIPPSYIHSLSTFVSSKVNYLSSSLSTRITPSSSSTSARAHEALEARYTTQLAFVNSLVRQVQSATSQRLSPAGAEEEDEDDADAPVRITTPSRPAWLPTLQGPFLLQPAPHDLSNGADDSACDISYLSPAAGGLGVLVVAYRDGKVDVLLEVEKVEGSADSDDEGVTETETETDLPTLAVYESIDLGLASELASSAVSSELRTNAPVLIRDPLYPDTLYVQHKLGAHCLLFGPWLEEVGEALRVDEKEDGREGSEVEKVLRKGTGTEVLWVLKTVGSGDEEGEERNPPVEGLAVVNDVYLGYSLLLLTSSLQLVGIELALRVDPSASALAAPSSPGPSASTTTDNKSAEPAYVSLLDTPFTVPPLLSTSSRSSAPAVPRLAPTKQPLEITPDTLRTFGKHVSTVQDAIRDLVGAADSVQSRLELQMKELSRQVGKLAELDSLRGELGKSVSATGLEGRLRSVEEKQRALLARTDRVLQRLIESHQPSISAYERKWFDELERLEGQIVGDDSGSLESRTRRLEAMLEALRPGLEELKRKEAGGGAQGTPGRKGGMGEAQVKALEARLAEEAKLIADAKRKVERLTSSLSATSLAAGKDGAAADVERRQLKLGFLLARCSLLDSREPPLFALSICESSSQEPWPERPARFWRTRHSESSVLTIILYRNAQGGLLEPTAIRLDSLATIPLPRPNSPRDSPPSPRFALHLSHDVMSRYTAEQVTGWFGTVLWCIQLVPQVYMNYRRKTTEGLSNLLCICWMLSGVTLGIFAIVENINIPIIVQPHAYGSLCFVMLCQMLYYDRKWRWYAAAGAFGAYACTAAGFEVGMVYASRAVEDRGSNGLTMLWGILSDVFLAVGFIPQFIEIYKAREVYALSYTFLAMDSAGAVFSIVSLAMKTTFDGIAFTGYLVVLVLEIAIFILALLLNPRARRRRAAAEKPSGVEKDESTHIAPEASESGMPLPSEKVVERHSHGAGEAGGREAERKDVERHETVESGVTLAEEGRASEEKAHVQVRAQGEEAV